MYTYVPIIVAVSLGHKSGYLSFDAKTYARRAEKHNITLAHNPLLLMIKGMYLHTYTKA